MKSTQIPPPPYLKDYVQYFWTLESNCTDLVPKTFGPLADGCPGLIFQPSEKGIFFDHDKKQLPEVFLYGQTVKRTAIYLIGKFRTTGICFSPNALKAIFRFSADEITDTCLNPDLVSPSQDGRLSEQLLNTPAISDQIDILSSYLFSRIRKNNIGVDAITSYALSKIMTLKGSISLKDLQKNFNLSERSFERKFNQYVGITPKLFARVCQFQSALYQLKTNNYTKLSDIAFDNGYADQSHFIRTFKEFAGFAPNQFQKEAYRSTDNFPVLIK